MSPTPIFVGGCPRSGTTYTRNVIASHPDVTGLTAHDFGLANGTDTLEGWLFHRKLSVDQIMARWRAATMNCRTPYVVEKTPANALIFKTIKCWFPDCVTVLVRRNEAGTVSSIVKASEWAPLPATKERATALYNRYQSARSPITVHYDLLRGSEEERARLYSAIGLKQYTGEIKNPEGLKGSKAL